MQHICEPNLAQRFYSIRNLLCFFGYSVLYLFISSNAHANNGGVHGPIVKVGHQQVDMRLSYIEATNSGKVDNWGKRFHYERSLNKELKIRFVAGFVGKTNFDFNNTKVELLYNFNKFKESSSDDRFASGIRLDLRARKGSAAEDIAVHWTSQYNLSSTQYVRGILILGQNIGPEQSHSLKLGTRFSYYQKINDRLDLGLELYDSFGEFSDVSDFDQQKHQIGPAVFYKFGKTKIFARYLFGLTDSTSDNTLSFRLTHNF